MVRGVKSVSARYTSPMQIMTPAQVAGDPASRTRFQFKVAYRDGRPRDESVVAYDADVLGSRSGLLAVAWLWPDQSFAAGVDPFERAAEVKPEEWSARLGTQVQHAIRVAADAVAGHGEHESVDDILRYLMWQADLSEGDVVRLRDGVVDQLAVWVRVCRCLHLEFDDGWWISDPARLAGRIQQALLASKIADELKHLPIGKLKDLWGRLPPRVDDPVPQLPREVYHAPRGRYRGLYLALAADTRESPKYAIGEMNDVLEGHGEGKLPSSATKDTSWWAGRGTKTEGRPQIAAWWAAGYRIAERFNSLAVNRDRAIELDLLFEDREPTDEEREDLSAITDVTFEALPGRREWLDSQDRVQRGEYRMPDSVSVPVPPLKAPHLLPDHADDRHLMAHQFPVDVVEWAPEPERDADADQPRGKHAEEDELSTLLQLLEAAGEMDREQIVRSLPAASGDGSGAHRPGGAGTDPDRSREIKSLLTRARRRGLIVNRGTNRKPRWVTVGSTGDLVLQIKQILDERRPNDDQPTIEVLKVGPGDALPAGFLAQVAARLGTRVPAQASDVELATAIIEWAGSDWYEDVYTSAEGLLTRDGLEAVRGAILSAT